MEKFSGFFRERRRHAPRVFTGVFNAIPGGEQLSLAGLPDLDDQEVFLDAPLRSIKWESPDMSIHFDDFHIDFRMEVF